MYIINVMREKMILYVYFNNREIIHLLFRWFLYLLKLFFFCLNKIVVKSFHLYNINSK
jgi:hypothetical protein